MSFNAELTEEQLTSVLKKGLYTDIQTEVEKHFISLAQMKFDAEIKPMIKQKVEHVVKQLIKVSTAIRNDHMTGHVVVQVEIR